MDNGQTMYEKRTLIHSLCSNQEVKPQPLQQTAQDNLGQ